LIGCVGYQGPVVPLERMSLPVALDTNCLWHHRLLLYVGQKRTALLVIYALVRVNVRQV
jgi:hypothetical protein